MRPGVLFTALASTLAGADFAQRLAQEQADALASLAPLPILLLWLGSINGGLAAFTMLPGFLLECTGADGGETWVGHAPGPAIADRHRRRRVTRRRELR